MITNSSMTLNAKTTTKNKRGRPKKEGVLREPNGRKSRSKKAGIQHALEMRAKKYNLTLEQACDPRSETHIGRLVLRGKEEGLSTEQYEAALKFLRIRNDYKRCMLSKDAYYEAQSLSSDGDIKEDYKNWVERVVLRYDLSMKAIEEAQFDNMGENLYAALQYVIVEDLDLPSLLGASRMVLNALHRHYNPISNSNRRSRYYRNSLCNMTNSEKKKLYTKLDDDSIKTNEKQQKNFSSMS